MTGRPAQDRTQPNGDAVTIATGIPFAVAVRTWLRIGLLSFGGPAGQIAVMHRILVDEKRWLSEARFLHALNFCMLLPGPEAQQLATYVGWLLHRVRGGLVAGMLFIAPGFLVILGLSYVYVRAGNLPVVGGLFLGLKAAVIAIVLQAVVRIGRRSMQTPGAKWIAGLAFVAMYFLDIAFPWVIAAAAFYGLARAARDRSAASTADAPLAAETTQRTWGVAIVCACLWLLPVIGLRLALGPDHVFTNIASFFSRMAVVTFGGAYAVLAYVAQEAVQVHAWLTPGEMIDGLAMAETTPGPLIMVLQFVGFMAAFRNPGTLPPLLAALLGGILTTWVTFAPCFLWIFLGAPYVERLRANRWVHAALSAVTAAVVGVIVHLAVWFGMHALFRQVSTVRIGGLALEIPAAASLSIATLFITIVALVLVFRLRASVLVTLTVTGGLGVAARFLR